jgi:hypothetical protein
MSAAFPVVLASWYVGSDDDPRIAVAASVYQIAGISAPAWRDAVRLKAAADANA